MTSSASSISRLLIVSRDKAVAKALSQIVCLHIGENMPYYFPNENIIAANCAEEICVRLDTMSPRELLDTICILDLPYDQTVSWNIDENDGGLRPSELILRYPEIYWIFVVLENHKQNWDNFSENAKKYHFVILKDPSDIDKVPELLSRHANGFRCWFDPMGLRRVVRGEEDKKIRGVSIDDEMNFAMMNGYVLYRKYYTTYVVNSLSEMKDVFEKGEPETAWLTLEDLQLNFRDLSKDAIDLGAFVSENIQMYATEVIDRRKEIFSCLEHADRKFVSSVPINKPGFISILKPYGGIYAKELEKIPRLPLKSSENNAVTHSVGPARAQYVAEALIDRALNLELEAKTVIAALHAALLAQDARSLLRDGALTLFIEALSVQHRMEVTAECLFTGIVSKLAVLKRLNDIDDDVKIVLNLKTNCSNHVRYQANNAIVGIIDDLRYIYREFGHLMEEEECLKRVRIYEWSLKYPKMAFNFDRFWDVMEYLPNLMKALPERYFISLMSGFNNIVVWIFTWILVFAGAYQWLECSGKIVGYGYGFREWLFHSAVTFLALQPGITGEPVLLNNLPTTDELSHHLKLIRESGFTWFWTLTSIELAFGFIHIGIVVSYLFQKISRR